MDRRYPVFLTEDEMKALQELAAINNCDIQLCLRRAIASEIFLQKKIKEGYNVLLENGEEIREVIFR